MRILVVEDDQTNLFVLKNLLGEYGEVDVASDGKGAIERFRAAGREGNAYDIICLDIMMPKMDGNEVLREIRRLEAAQGEQLGDEATIIMITALSDKDVMKVSFRERCDAYLVKPITKEDVHKILKKLGLV